MLVFRNMFSFLSLDEKTATLETITWITCPGQRSTVNSTEYFSTFFTSGDVISLTQTLKLNMR